MSADIWLESKDGDKLDFGEHEYIPMRVSHKAIGNAFNLTYNLTPMLKEAGMPSWREFTGMDADKAGAIWKQTVQNLTGEPERFKALNPENGWGNYDDAVEVLSALVDVCKAYPHAKIGGWL